MSFVVNPLGPGAAEIIGLDCSRPLADDVFRSVKQEFLQHPVLVFRNQTLSAPQLAAFGRRFGRLDGYGCPLLAADDGAAKPQTAALRQTDARETPDQMLYLNPDDSDVLIMTNEVRLGLAPVGIVDNAEMWHSDASHKPDPCQAIIVHVLRNPASGGDTEFCDLRAIYDALTPEIKAALDGRTAIHHWSKSRNPRFAGALDPAAREEGERIAGMIPEMPQPVVRTHPETGRRALYVNAAFTIEIVGMEAARSKKLLKHLYAQAAIPEYQCRFRWEANSIAFWDNRASQHYAASDYWPAVRRMERVTVIGDTPR